jgi:pyridoxamine 5'-phosphate oxidase
MRILSDVSLNSGNLDACEDPFTLFSQWFDEAKAKEPNDPEAMALATVDSEGLPDVRMVLCKGIEAGSLKFYTNAESAKGRQIEAQPKAAALFHWKSLRRQARFRGPVSFLDDKAADDYFHSRARQSQIGAWASQQSRPLESRAALVMKAAEYAAKFGFGQVPRPEYWRGYRITPVEVELWSDGAFRLHDRVRFTRAGDGWTKRRLNP